MFEKFVQVDATDARQKGGTGLGLSIVKQIVLRLGGEVGLDPALGGGTIFHVELPCWDHIELLETERLGRAGNALILLCEDDPDAAAVLAERLRAAGLCHRYRRTAEEAVKGAAHRDLRCHPGRPATAGQRRHQPDQELARPAALPQHADRRGLGRSQARPRRPALLDAQRARLAGKAGGHRAAAARPQPADRARQLRAPAHPACRRRPRRAAARRAGARLDRRSRVRGVDRRGAHVLDTHHFDLAVLDVGAGGGLRARPAAGPVRPRRAADPGGGVLGPGFAARWRRACWPCCRSRAPRSTAWSRRCGGWWRGKCPTRASIKEVA